MLLIGLSLCIPLIPLMLAASDSLQLPSITLSFAIATVASIVVHTYLSYKALKPPTYGREDVIAGILIAIVGSSFIKN